MGKVGDNDKFFMIGNFLWKKLIGLNYLFFQTFVIRFDQESSLSPFPFGVFRIRTHFSGLFGSLDAPLVCNGVKFQIK